MLMADLTELILAGLQHRSYKPLKPRGLARKLGVHKPQYPDFCRTLRTLHRQGRIEVARDSSIRLTQPHGTVVGVYRSSPNGYGFVRPHGTEKGAPAEVFIPAGRGRDAATGDEVLVRLLKKPSRPDLSASGEILEVVERATRQFVGTYFERGGESFVRVDGTVFSHSIYVGDPGAKGAKPEDKVVFEMVRFPSAEDRGEGVITEILGPRGQPGVDTLSVIRAFGLPEAFPEEALQEARKAAANFQESDLHNREDFTGAVVITIDPVDARDFDDAVSLTLDDETKHWQLTVHIADVAHFAPPGGPLDLEARRRATSVYLPQRVLPMFPEIISNNLASLQQDHVRYVKTVVMDFAPEGVRTGVRFANGAIKVRKRFAYEQVSALLEGGPQEGIDPEVMALLLRLRDLALILRRRRHNRGALELAMPEVELEFDNDGRINGAHFRKHDISHQMIEECMLTANEAVAEHLARLRVPFLRRVHPDPEPNKLKAFAEFARILGYKIKRETDRFALQRVLEESAGQPAQHAIHYALLRSLKQATYSPEDDGHYALASQNYCHFTSPIRRYPDLTVHRLLDRWLRTGRAGSDAAEMAALGVHCSRMERRAETAERELVKFKLLSYMSERLGTEMGAIVTGVADYGFYAQAEQFPVEGLVHISTLEDDYYDFDEASYSLTGRRRKRRYRLGDKVKVRVVRVDLQRKQLDFRVIDERRREPAE
jgi:ribonuclease R